MKKIIVEHLKYRCIRERKIWPWMTCPSKWTRGR